MRRFFSCAALLWIIVAAVLAVVLLVAVSLGISPPWRLLVTWAALAGVVLTLLLALAMWLDNVDPLRGVDPLNSYYLGPPYP